ncbi:uncharacterized protein LOC144497276 [Mustelus asterias]
MVLYILPQPLSRTMWTTWRMILAATFLTSVAPKEHPIYPRFHGVAFNTSEALCVPAGPDPMNSRTYLNAWLQVYPGINEICFTCTLEGLRTCIQQRDLQNRDQCVFGTLCALPDNPQEARPQDTLNSNMDICGYYGLVEAPAVSLYVCFAPLPTRAPTTTRPEILPCPLQSRGPEGGLVLWNEGEIVYDNVKHEVVPVLIDISGIQVPRHCSERVQNLYQMLERETIKRAIDAMGATHYRGNINTNTYRSKRGIINDMLTGLNTGDTMINSIDIQGLNSKIEQLKGVMKNILQRSLDQQAEQAFLGEAGAHIQLDGIAVLEAHARTINRLIDREREDTARVQQGQLCHAYGQWMVAQVRHNLDQVHRGEVPDWIDSAQLAQLADQKGVLDDRTLKGMTRVYPVIPDCEVSEGTGIGMVLLIPTVTQDAGPFPIFRIENIGVVRGNASLRYHITENMAISKHGIMSSVSLAGCKQRGEVTICPHPLRQGEAAECGFNRTQDCTLEIIPVDPHFARAGYGGRGRYCVATTRTSFTYNGLTCPIPDPNFCFTPRKPVTIGQAHITNIRNRQTIAFNATDPLKDNLRDYQEPEQAPIPHLTEVLRELRLKVGHSVRLYHRLQSHIKTLEQDTETALRSQTWVQKVWDWGLNVNIHPWVRITSHTLVVIQLILALSWGLVTCYTYRQRKRMKAHKNLVRTIGMMGQVTKRDDYSRLHMI